MYSRQSSEKQLPEVKVQSLDAECDSFCNVEDGLGFEISSFVAVVAELFSSGASIQAKKIALLKDERHGKAVKSVQWN